MHWILGFFFGSEILGFYKVLKIFLILILNISLIY